MQYEVVSRFVKIEPPLMVELDSAQAGPRAHNLKRIGDAYEVVRPVEFKRGETIGLSRLPKNLVHALAPVATRPEGGDDTLASSSPSSSPTRKRR